VLRRDGRRALLGVVEGIRRDGLEVRLFDCLACIARVVGDMDVGEGGVSILDLMHASTSILAVHIDLECL
jgi:hypothetical protein